MAFDGGRRDAGGLGTQTARHHRRDGGAERSSAPATAARPDTVTFTARWASITGGVRAPGSSPTRTPTRASSSAVAAAFTWKSRSPSTSRWRGLRFWRNFENLPQFMEHLDRSRCARRGSRTGSAKGPAGMNVEWDARIINEIENKLIGWQSLDGSTVATAGSVNFDETAHGTRVRVHLQYNPPGGARRRRGAAVRRGAEARQIREDLRRFKQLLETGEIPTTEGQPSRTQVASGTWSARR